MKFKTKLLSAIFLLGALLALILFTSRRSEPYYSGKPLSFWVYQLPCTIPTAVNGGWREVPQMRYMGQPYGSTSASNAAIAIREIGTNALPYLLHLMEQKDSNSKKRGSLFMREMGLNISPSLMQFSNPMRWQAITAFRILGTNALPAVEPLRLIQKDPEYMIHYGADLILTGLSTNQNEKWFLPSLGTNLVAVQPTP